MGQADRKGEVWLITCILPVYGLLYCLTDGLISEKQFGLDIYSLNLISENLMNFRPFQDNPKNNDQYFVTKISVRILVLSLQFQTI